MVTQDQVAKVVAAADDAIAAAQAVGHAEVDKETSDAALAAAQADDAAKGAALADAENEFNSKKDALDAVIADLKSSF